MKTADRGAVFGKSSEVQALKDNLSSHQSQSALVQSIIAAQKDADDKIRVSAEEAQRMLGQVGALLEAKSDDVEGDAVREFLVKAGEAVAQAEREQFGFGGKAPSTREQETLTAIASALKATEADKRRRHDAAVAAEARKRAEAQEAQANREAEAQKQAAEQARIKNEAEAQKYVEEVARRVSVSVR